MSIDKRVWGCFEVFFRVEGDFFDGIVVVENNIGREVVVEGRSFYGGDLGGDIGYCDRIWV